LDANGCASIPPTAPNTKMIPKINLITQIPFGFAIDGLELHKK
jgi:hypothetical protein